jgi:EAL and modified HD-GYP domain-containing signal transduction protein
MTLDEIASIVEELKEFPHIELLAEKVETLEEFEQCKALGFKYFQGYFFSYPEVVKAKSLSPAQMTLAELLYETSAQELDLPKITQIFERDINLAYKLLRYSNSAIFKRRAEISTIKQALVVLGQYELKKFLSLLFAAQVNSSKPEELLKMAMIRARFCEDLAQAEGSQDQGMAFLTGMMSLIDAILDDHIEKIMEQLPLAAEIKAALVKGEGKLAEYLALAKAYERGSWDDVEQIRDSLELSVQQAPSFYNESIQWATEQMRALES